MSGGEGPEVFLLGASALERIALGDVLVDYAHGSASIDLSAMIQTLLEQEPADAATPGVADTLAANEAAVVPLETVLGNSATGIAHVMTILYEDGPVDPL